MAASLHDASFEGPLLQRGFWLYVWEILSPDGRTVHYVGKTGDKASRVCQSPFNRLTNHLSGNKHSNALKRHLVQMDIRPEICSFRFFAYGPLFEHDDDKTHGELCDITSGLEKALAQAMATAGYDVMNRVHSRVLLQFDLFEQARIAFAKHFTKLAPGVGNPK